MNVLVCAPHPDDEMIGMGGTIAKYVAEGHDVTTVIFTLGEQGNPWQKKEAITETRRQEAIDASKIAGTKEPIFLELADLRIGAEVVEKNTMKEFLAIIKKTSPDVVFMPALDDVHSDHRAVARFVRAARTSGKHEFTLWMYTVWNPFFLLHRTQPRLVIDITKHFSTKWKSIQVYRSQKISTFQLIPTVLLRGLLHGIRFGHVVSEVFLLAPEEQR